MDQTNGQDKANQGNSALTCFSAFRPLCGLLDPWSNQGNFALTCFSAFRPMLTWAPDTIYLYASTSYMRKTQGLICWHKEDGLVSRPPTLFTSVHRPMAMHSTSCPKPQLGSTCLTAKFGSLLDYLETGEKRQNVISPSVQHLISLIFAIHVSFIIPLPSIPRYWEPM